MPCIIRKILVTSIAAAALSVAACQKKEEAAVPEPSIDADGRISDVAAAQNGVVVGDGVPPRTTKTLIASTSWCDVYRMTDQLADGTIVTFYIAVGRSYRGGGCSVSGRVS